MRLGPGAFIEFPIHRTYIIYDNTSVQRNIVENINNRFLDFHRLAKVPISPYSYDFLVSKSYSKIEKISCV